MSRVSVVWLSLLLCGTVAVNSLHAQVADSALCDEAVATLRKAASYYRGKVASRGGYVYYYSADLTQRWGEGTASADTIFVQTPGTPSVGMAYREAFDATSVLKSMLHAKSELGCSPTLARLMLRTNTFRSI